jgi:tRNA pseudouridine55 synthase
MEQWRGTIRQTPPQFSACQVDGRRAYDLARQGVQVELASREVIIYQLDLLKYAYPQVSLHVQCSSGTYIRSLGHDMAVALGSDAVMSRLVRTAIGPYSLTDCFELDQINNLAEVHQAICSPVGLVAQFPKFKVSADECERLRTGSTLELTTERVGSLESYGGTLQEWHCDQLSQFPIVALNSDEQLVAILEIRQDCLQPTRVFL